jgi:hypothetical protein
MRRAVKKITEESGAERNEVARAVFSVAAKTSEFGTAKLVKMARESLREHKASASM